MKHVLFAALLFFASPLLGDFSPGGPGAPATFPNGISLTGGDLAIPADKQSEVWVHTGNGFGSTAIRTRRFVTTLVNTGTDITFADTASNGSTFTINTDGVYAITYADRRPGGSTRIGITVNAVGNTDVGSGVAVANRLTFTDPDSSAYEETSTVARLSAGDVIRAMTTADSYDDASDKVFVRVVRVGS